MSLFHCKRHVFVNVCEHHHKKLPQTKLLSIFYVYFPICMPAYMRLEEVQLPVVVFFSEWLTHSADVEVSDRVSWLKIMNFY